MSKRRRQWPGVVFRTRNPVGTKFGYLGRLAVITMHASRDGEGPPTGVHFDYADNAGVLRSHYLDCEVFETCADMSRRAQ